MYAITLNGFGDPEVMEWAQVDDLPAPGAGEVGIDVVAAGVNRADVMQRMGLYPPPGVSEIPGLEVSGIVAEVGAGVQDWAPGDAVCALLAGGGLRRTGKCGRHPGAAGAAGRQRHRSGGTARGCRHRVVERGIDWGPTPRTDAADSRRR